MTMKNSVVLLFTVLDGILSTPEWKIKLKVILLLFTASFEHDLWYLVLVSDTA